MFGVAIVFYFHGKKCFNPFPWKFSNINKAMNRIGELQKANPNVEFCLYDLEGDKK